MRKKRKTEEITIMKHSFAFLDIARIAAALSFLALPISPGAAGKLLSETDIDGDGERELALENKYCKMILKPSLGKIVSLAVKPSNAEVLCNAEGGKGALLADYFEQQGSFGDFGDKPYTVEAVADTDEKAVLRLTRSGSTDLLRWITIVKTIAMRADRAAIEVEYEVSNKEESMEAYQLGLGIFNMFGAVEEVTMSLPLTGGVLHKVLNPLVEGQKEQAYDNIARGWASVALDSGRGVAFKIDYAGLKKFYEWHKGATRTFEWIYLSEKVEQGKSFRQKIQVIPFQGVTQVDGVVDGYAGAITFAGVPETGKKTPVCVRLFGGGGELPAARIGVTRMSDGKETVLGELPMTAESGFACSASAEFTPEQNGLYVVRAVVSRGRDILGEFERPLNVGQTGAAYILKPLGPKNSEDKDALARTIPRPAGKAKGKQDSIALQDLPPDIELSNSIKTPHIPWANPYYLGKTKVFLICASSQEREVIELEQRFSMDYFRVTHAVTGWKAPWPLRQSWSAPVAAAHQKKILETQSLDVILMSAPWDNLDPDVQKLIVKRVENGTGLVIMSPSVRNAGSYGYKYACALSGDDLKKFPEGLLADESLQTGRWKAVKNHFITAGVPFDIMRSHYTIHPAQSGEVLAEADAKPLIVAGELGRGRVVALNYITGDFLARDHAFIPRLHPFNTGSGVVLSNPDCPEFEWWEYCWSLVIKSALWASGREPDLAIESIAAAPNLDKVELALDNRGSEGLFTFALSVRNGFSKIEYERAYTRKIGGGKSKIELEMEGTDLSGGTHFADVIIRSGDLSVNWGTALLEVPQVVAINSLKLENEYLKRGEPVKASAGLGAPLAGNLGLEAWGLVYDVRGRLLAEEKLSVAEGATNVAFTLPTDRVETIPFYVHLQLRKGDRVVSEKKTRAIAAQMRSWDDYIYALQVSTGSLNYYQLWWIDQLRRNGVNVLISRMKGGTSLGYCLESDMNIFDDSRLIVGWSYHEGGGQKEQEYRKQKADYARTKDTQYLERNPCFNNPKYREELLDNLRKVVDFMKRYGRMDYSLTDELSMTNYGDSYDFCFCAHCRKAFREWVKPQYRDLKDLNEAYGMNFASWDEVRMASTDEARESGKWAGWADHRAFNEYSMHAFFRWLGDEARKLHPEAEISLSGTQAPTPYNGHDVWLRSQTFDNLTCYGYGQQTRMHRSFNPGLRQIPWGGYGSFGASMHHKIWDNAFQGGHGNAFWWFPINLNPDFTMNPCSQAWTDAARDLLGGIGRTILASSFDDCGICVHYSQASVHASYILDAGANFDADRSAWTEGLIEGNQLNMRFISYAQIERGDLVFPKVKVLVLPYSIAISDKEAAAIREFVHSGGTLIADMQTGIMDEHCRPRPAGALDDVLGIKRGSADIRPVLEAGQWARDKNWDFAPEDLGIQLQEPGIAATTGRALYSAAGVPGVIMNSFGKGRAWYLNFHLAKYEVLQKNNRHGALKELAARILSMAGCSPFASVVDASGKALPLCNVYTFHRAPMHFVGILPDLAFPGTNMPAKLVIPPNYKLFDMRKRAAADPDKITLSPGMAHFYSLLPYRVKGLDLKGPASAKPGATIEIAMQLGAEGGSAGDHVIRVETFNPAGEYVYYYSDNIVSTKGAATHKIALPLNAASGKWRVTARDLPSGVSGVLEFNVENGARPPAAAVKTAPVDKPAKGAWGPSVRPPRELFAPVTNREAVFDLSKSILANPGLKTGKAPGAPPESWDGHVSFNYKPRDYAAHVKIEEDPEMAFENQPSARISVTPADDPLVFELEQRIDMKTKDLRGKKLRLTFYAYRDKPPAGREFFVVAPLISKGPDGKDVSEHSILATSPVVEPGKWVRVCAEGVVRPETTVMRVSLRNIITAPDTLWLSGFLLETAD